jgi:hypothetical protein
MMFYARDVALAQQVVLREPSQCINSRMNNSWFKDLLS